MKIEQFFDKWWRNHPDPDSFLTGSDFRDDYTKKTMIGFAQAYLKETVNNISEDEIEMESYHKTRGSAKVYEAFINGATWFKEKLLEQ